MTRRAALVLEILWAYAEARRVMARPLPEAVARQRAVSGDTEPRLTPRLAEARRLASATLRVLRFVPADTRCLARSLTLTRLLARRGLCGTLVLGVCRDPEFAAHAWVEVDGIAILPDGGNRFARLHAD